jgi:hypothetical protein
MEILKDERLLFWETHLLIAECDLLHNLTYQVLLQPLNEESSTNKFRCLNSNEKLLLVLMWIKHYKTLTELSIIFGITDFQED